MAVQFSELMPIIRNIDVNHKTQLGNSISLFIWQSWNWLFVNRPDMGTVWRV